MVPHPKVIELVETGPVRLLGEWRLCCASLVTSREMFSNLYTWGVTHPIHTHTYRCSYNNKI